MGVYRIILHSWNYSETGKQKYLIIKWEENRHSVH